MSLLRKEMKYKVCIFFAGVIAGFILLETALRIIGYIHLSIATSDKLTKKTGDYVILCVGDSYTYGTGAPQEKSYPRQLERLLNKEVPGKRFMVINRGVGGYNTSLLLNRFNIYLEEFNPDLVVLLIGGANIWNATGYEHYLQSKALIWKARDLLYSIKTYKLIKLLCLYAKGKINNNATPPVLNNGSYSRIFPWHDRPEYEKMIKRQNQEALPYIEVGISYQDEGKFDKAIEWYEKAIAKCPKSDMAYYLNGLAYSILHDYKKSAQNYRKAIELNPQEPLYSSQLPKFCIENLNMVEENIAFFDKLRDVNPAAEDFVKMLSNLGSYGREIKRWVMFDIEEMIRICQRRQVRIILQNYPWVVGYDATYLPRGSINIVLKEAAQRYHVPFADNYRILQEMKLKGERIEEYRSSDGAHCNAKGYAVIARNIYNKIIEERMLDIKN